MKSCFKRKDVYNFIRINIMIRSMNLRFKNKQNFKLIQKISTIKKIIDKKKIFLLFKLIENIFKLILFKLNFILKL